MVDKKNIMIDFNLDIQAETQLWHFVFFLIVYFLVFFTNNKLLKQPFQTEKKNVVGSLILFVSFVLMSIVAVTRGDFYHYADMVQNRFHEEHLEDFYLWLSEYVNHNYLLWRIVIWGSAIILILLTTKRLEVNIYYTIFVFFICYIHIFNYARVSLAGAVYFYGLSYIIKPTKSKLLGYIIGAIIIWSSHFFHNSIYVLIVLTTVVLIPINKYTIVAVIVSFIILAPIGYKYLFDSMTLLEGSETYADSFIYYSDSNKQILRGGVSGFVTTVLSYGSFFVPLFVFLRRLLISKNKPDKLSNYLFKMVFSIILVSIALGSISGTAYFFYRILYMSIIPISILLALCYMRGYITQKDLKLCIYWGLINVLNINLYGIYCRLI